MLLPAIAQAQEASPPSVANEDVGGGGTSASTTAEAAQDVHDTTTRRGDEYHAPEEQAIVVTGFVHNRQDLLSGTSVMSGEELTRELRPTIGDTLSRLPGVSATSFGPNASRPVLRGFQGARADPHRRHRQPRRLQHQRRPCGVDQSAHRRPDGSAARTLGPAVRILGDRRRRQRRRLPRIPRRCRTRRRMSTGS